MSLRQPHRLAVAATAVVIGVAACAAERSVEPSEADEARSGRSAADPASGPAPETTTAHAEIEYMTFALNHYMAAVATARICLHKATHHELRSFCERAVERQTERLRQLQAWLQHWYGIHHTLHVTSEDQRDLEQLAARDGAEFEIELMTVMSARQMRMIEASRHLLERVHHAHLRELATNVMTHGTQEVSTMRSWLCQWYRACDHAGARGSSRPGIGTIAPESTRYAWDGAAFTLVRHGSVGEAHTLLAVRGTARVAGPPRGAQAATSTSPTTPVWR